MARSRRGCGCAVAVLLAAALAAGVVGWKFVLPWWKRQPPPASGGELQVHILDVGPVDGDSILIISPAGKVALIDAGDVGKGNKVVLDALKRYGVQQIDYFIATHAHPDHIGGAAEVLKAVKTLNVLHNGFPPPEWTEQQEQAASQNNKNAKDKNQAGKQANAKQQAKPAKAKGKSTELPTVKTYNEFKSAAEETGAQFRSAQAGDKFDLGGGALLTVIAPVQPFFTEEQVRSGGGNLPNANSIVMRLDYGDFNMMLAGDAESVTEQRIISKNVNPQTSINLQAKILKVAHHGSKYATSEEFLSRVKPEVAIISDGEYNRYGHPSQTVLDRLKSAGVGKLFRTDAQGEITITTKGKENDYQIKTAKEGKDVKGDLWTGREAQKDDSERSGFIAYGDFGPPPRPPKEKTRRP